jgi:tRNA threonylcarbamoyladenosine biosynthesis protein TsaB
MKLLAIDTSGDTCSAALLLDGSVDQLLENAPRRHGDLILPMMQQLLEGAGVRLAELDALAFGRGPGSFTGVRIAISVTQGAAFGAGLPVVPVSTLAALAQGQFRRAGQRHLLTALDARMGEVYWGCFDIGDDDLAVPCCAERVCPPGAVEAPQRACWHGVGPGWQVYAGILSGRIGSALQAAEPHQYCEAQDIAILAAAEFAYGRQIMPELATPVYLRDQVTRAA